MPLLDVDHPPLATLIKEFYSNFSVHSNDSNTQFLKSWIRGEEYVITSTVVASALGVPKVQHPVYPYDEYPPLDDIMSYLTRSSIQWGFDSQITSHELTKIHYLFFPDFLPFYLAHLSFAYYSYREMCIFYALVTNAPMSFPHLLIRSLVEVHRSSSFAHALFFSVFIHQILLHLGLDEFPASEPIHVIVPIGATFLR